MNARIILGLVAAGNVALLIGWDYLKGRLPVQTRIDYQTNGALFRLWLSTLKYTPLLVAGAILLDLALGGHLFAW